MPGLSKLSLIKMGPFTIQYHVGNLVYKLDLPVLLQIHPVISIAYLKQVLKDTWHQPIYIILLEDIYKCQVLYYITAILIKDFYPIFGQNSKWKLWHYQVQCVDSTEMF